MRVTKLVLITACVLALAAAASSPRSAVERARPEAAPQIPDKVAMTLRGVMTAVDGPTAEAASAGTVLSMGESGTVYITTVGVDPYGQPNDSLCFGYVGSPAPANDQLRYALHIWRATFRLVSATMKSIVVSVDWSRETASHTGVFKREAGGVRTVTLREGESHTLDFLTADAGEHRCGASLRIDASASVYEDPKLAARRIAYDLWLLDESPGREPLTRHFEAVARHGEEIPFSFAPLRWTVPGAKLADGKGVEAIGDISGAIRGRMREDGTIDVILGADRWLGTAPAGGDRTGSTGDGGRKTLRMTPGETLALVLPSPGGSSSINTRSSTSPGENPGAAGESKALENAVTVDWSRFLDDHTMSLRLRARPEQP